MTIAPLHQAAREWASAGFPVFPLIPGTKKPIHKGGHHNATTSLKQIDAWWGESPDANIGVDPDGAGCGVVDAEHNADRIWVRKLPPTFTIQTPRKGLHLWFEGSLRNSVKELAANVDTRGAGDGYAILPPSVVGGQVYRVVRQVPIAPLPAWLSLPAKQKPLSNGHHPVELDQPANVARAIARLKRLPEVREGDGANNRTFQVACEMRDLGLSADKAFEVMLEHYKCEPKDSRYNGFLHTTIAHAYTYAKNAPAVHAAKSFADHPAVKASTITVRASNIQEKPTEFLFYPYLPAGGLTIFAGRGGDGKGLVSSSLTATITRGGAWPCSGEHVSPGNVLWCEAEDDLHRTLKPRWVAAGADCERIEVITPKHFAELDIKAHVKVTGTRLIVFSPLIEFMKDLQDINAELNVRAALHLVQEAVEDTNCAVLAIMHLNKKGDLPAIERVLGSGAFTNYVRSVLMVVCEDADAAQYRLVHAKHNLSKKGRDLHYSPESIDTNERGQRVRLKWWKSDSNVDVAAIYERKKATPKTDETEQWLRAFLANGPKASAEVFSAAQANGFADITVRRVAKKMGVDHKKVDLEHGWIMSLPVT